MANPHNPIDHYGVNEAAPAGGAEWWEYERRVQTLLAKWMKTYFSGTPFQIDNGQGGVMEISFPECYLLFGQARYPQGGIKPIIHWQLSDERGREDWKKQGKITRSQVLTWNVLVRVSPQHEEQGHDDSVCRRVAAGLHMLLSGNETQALSHEGLGHVRVLRGPIQVASSPAFIRQLVVTMELWQELPSNVG